MITIKGNTTPIVQKFIRDIEKAFFTDINITVEFSNRRTSRRAGTFFQTQYKVIIYSNHPSLIKDNYHVAAVTAHELGHAYQHRTDKQTFFNATPYGLEIYADDFASMVLGNLWKDEYRSYYPVYKGYKTKRLTR